MAKLGSFFRRLFTPLISDESEPSSETSIGEIKKTGMKITPPPPSTPQLATINTRSCTTTTTTTPSNADSKRETSKSNYLSSDINRPNIRRLSAPLLIQTSGHPHPQYPSTIVNEVTEEALLSSLQRASFSSSIPTTTTCTNHSVHSLTATNSTGGGGDSSGCFLSRPEVRSASFNLPTSSSSISNNNIVNNISSASGRWRKVSFQLFSYPSN